MNTKYPIVIEVIRGRIGFIVGPIATYEWDEALRLANDSDEPIAQPADPVVLIDFVHTTRTHCLVKLTSRPEARGDVYVRGSHEQLTNWPPLKDKDYL